MGVFPGNKKFEYLIYLHYTGLISLPDYHDSKWCNMLHKYVYRSFVYGCCCTWILCQLINIFFFAINDLTEFLQRLLECLYFMTFILEVFMFNLNLQGCLDLLEVMDRIFVPCKNKYSHEERNVILTIIGLSIGVGITFSLDTFLPLPDHTKNVMIQVYHKEYPYWRLPWPIWLPFDVNNITNYSLAFMFETYLVWLMLLAVFQLVLLETIFSTPVLEQYEILQKNVELIGGAISNKMETNRFEDLQRNKMEHEMHIRKVLIQNQKLNSFIQQLKDYIRVCTNPIFYPTIVMVPLSTYQLALLSQLPTTTGIKIIVEFVFLMYGLVHYVNESEKFDSCYKLVRDGILDSKWYLTTPGTRRAVCMMLRIVQRSNIITYYSGFIKFNYNFLLSTLRAAYTFVNFLQLTEKL